jgi:uncharacterized phage protein (TIGR01671 family)
MKREIKFRIFDPAQKLFIHPSKFSFNADFSQKFFRGDLKLVKESHSEKCIINQFTGLLDKNGVEIYEGDVVLCNDGRVAEVVWHEYGWYVQSKPFSKMEKSYAKMDKDNDSAILIDARRYGKLSNTEVIGNLHQNPE